MTAVFRSCLPRFYSNTNQSIISEHLSNKTNSIISFDQVQLDHNCSSILNIHPSKTITQHNPSSPNQPSEQKQTKISRPKNTKKRGPRYSRINEKAQPLLTRLVGTIFGDHVFNDDYQQHQSLTNKPKQKTKRLTRPSKKSILPSTKTIQKQFEDNEQTLRTLVTLLAQIESDVKLTATQTSNENQQESNTMVMEHQNDILPIDAIQNEQARNNNRMDDDSSSSHSNESYNHHHHRKTNKDKHSHQHSSASKRNRSTKKAHQHTNNHSNNKKRESEENSRSSSSIISHYISQSSPTNRRKMVDNQQQTQLYPTKNNIGTSTQFHDTTTSEPSWFDVMREDQTTINAWSRIRRRLKPNQQKDILRPIKR